MSDLHTIDEPLVLDKTYINGYGCAFYECEILNQEEGHKELVSKEIAEELVEAIVWLMDSRNSWANWKYSYELYKNNPELISDSLEENILEFEKKVIRPLEKAKPTNKIK